MFSRCLSALLIASFPAIATASNVFRVCADPNNMPFSDQGQQGFENKLASLVANALHAKLEYVWWSERKAFLDHSLNENRCDAVMEIPSSTVLVATTQPYYRSSYVFVSRRDRQLHLTSLNDPRLNQWRIGVHVVGDNYAPPAYVLARRGLTANITGFSLFGKFGDPNPPRKIVDAVENGSIDVAIVWGPFAGYFAQSEKSPLDIQPVSPSSYSGIPFSYGISIGVRKSDGKLKMRIDQILAVTSGEIQRLLAAYGIPRVE
jgi:quinoprotein dehydrogenase-associated probable ABC transporter substrate-binding protein